MTFGAPQWFEGFLLVPLLAGLFLRNEMLREHLLNKLVAARLLPDLASSTSARWVLSPLPNASAASRIAEAMLVPPRGIVFVSRAITEFSTAE